MAYYAKGRTCKGCKGQEYRTPTRTLRLGIDETGYCEACRKLGRAVADPNAPVSGQLPLL